MSFMTIFISISQNTRSDIMPQVTWTVNLLTAEDYTNLPRGYMWVRGG